MRFLLALVLVIASPACKGKDASGEASARVAPADAVGAANAKLPAELKTKLVFETLARPDVGGTLVVPRGWASPDAAPARPGQALLRAPDDALGGATKLIVDAWCTEPCPAREDWTPEVDKIFAARASEPGHTMMSDDRGEGWRVTMQKRDDGARIYVFGAFWKQGGVRLVTYYVELDRDGVGAAPAFVEAVRGTRIETWTRP